MEEAEQALAQLQLNTGSKAEESLAEQVAYPAAPESGAAAAGIPEGSTGGAPEKAAQGARPGQGRSASSRRGSTTKKVSVHSCHLQLKPDIMDL